MVIYGDLPSGYVKIAIVKIAIGTIIGIVDLPIQNGGSFHSYVNVYQRVMGKTIYHEKFWIFHCHF